MAAPYSLSLSDPATPSAGTSEIQRTNTLAPLLFAVLRDHFTHYGHIDRWVPLPGFGRILIVYTREDDAESAKVHSDPIVLEQTHDRPPITLPVYRADPNPLLPKDSDDLVPEANYLRPPAIEKNFLISPPGSPPVGWEPIKEEPPNATPLADDLTYGRAPQTPVLIELEDGGSGVGVYVENCDGEEEEEEDWVYGESAPTRGKWRPVTALPPVGA
ncbi:Calcipressin-domain-containing protein [Mycena filopes]|nr:Calcipressin-domain-containing protein [Mycena filopes]